MSAPRPRLVIVVRPGLGHRKLAQLRAWLRALVPTALLLVAPATFADPGDDDVIHLDGADALDGPLALATVLARRLGR